MWEVKLKNLLSIREDIGQWKNKNFNKWPYCQFFLPICQNMSIRHFLYVVTNNKNYIALKYKKYSHKYEEKKTTKIWTHDLVFRSCDQNLNRDFLHDDTNNFGSHTLKSESRTRWPTANTHRRGEMSSVWVRQWLGVVWA